MSVIRSRPGTPNALSRPASSSRRAQRARHRAILEPLEDRRLLAYTFSITGTTGTATSNGVSDILFLRAQGGLIAHSIDGTNFSTDWSGTGTTLAASAGSTVNILQGTTNTHPVTLGTPSNPASGLLALINIEQGGPNDSLVVDDSGSAAVTTYTYDGGAGKITATGINVQSSVTPLAGGDTLEGGSAANTFIVKTTYSFGGVGEPVSIVGGAGNDTAQVASTSSATASAPLTIDLKGGASNSVTLGSVNANLQNIGSPVTVNDTGGTTGLVLDDSSDSGARTAMINATSVTGLAAATINYGALALSALTIKGGTGGNTFTVNSTPATITTNLNAGAGNDRTNVLGTGTGSTLNLDGQAGSNTVLLGGHTSAPLGMQNLLGTAVSVASTGGTTALTLDDSQDTTARTATISGTSVTGLAPAAISYGAANLSALAVNGGTGGNTFTVNSTLASITTNLNTGAGNDGTNVVSTGAGSTLDLDSQAGANTVVLGGSTSVPLGMQNLLGQLNLGATGGTTALTLDDSQDTAAATATISDTSVTGLSPTTINYGTSNLSALEVNGGSGGNTFTVNSTPTTITTSLNTGAGDDTTNVFGTGTGSTLNLDGQDGSNTVVLGGNTSAPLGMQNLLGDLVNVAATGTTDLTLDDSQDTTATTATIDDVETTGLSPASINYALAGLTSLTINGGSGGNTFTVNFTPASITTSLNTGGGDDATTVFGTDVGSTLNIDSQGGSNTVILGGNTTLFSGGAQQLQGLAVNVSDTGGTTNLTIDDSENIFFESVIMTGTDVTGIAPATINFTPPDASGNGVNVLTVDGGSGFYDFTIDGTLANSVSPFETLNTGTGFSDVTVEATTATGPLTINSQSVSSFISLGNNGDVSGILGPVTITGMPGGTSLVVDASTDPSDHTDIVLQNTAADTATLTGLTPATVTYSPSDLSFLTIDTNGATNETLNLNFGGGGNPIPAAGTLGLTFDAGDPAAGVSHILNIFGQLPTGPFTSETHGANDQTVFPQVGQYGSIAFVDSTSIASGLDYSGLQPVNDTAPAALYTFNDFGYPDQSFLAQDGPAVMGFDTIQFVNTPTPPSPLNFETTTIANKGAVVFNTPPLTPGVGPAVNGLVNIPTGSTGLTSLAFNTPNDASNDVSFVALPPAVNTAYTGGGANDTTNVTGMGVASGTILSLNGGPGVNTLNYDSGGLVPTITAGALPGEVLISLPGFGTVDAVNYQTINTSALTAPVITPGPARTINTVEGFNYVNAIVGTFTAPITAVSGPAGFPASDFTASIDWGDLLPSDPGAGTITQDASNPSIYYITGTHTFAQQGTYTVSSTIAFTGGSFTTVVNGTPVTVTFAPGAPTLGTPATATVTQGPLAVSVFPIAGTEGASITSAPIATFIDAGGANPFTDYSAALSVVNSSGLVTIIPGATIAQIGDSAQYTVTAPAFTLPEEGTYQVLVAITDNSATPAPPITVTGASTATIADAALTAAAQTAIVANTGIALPATTVAGTFDDANPDGTAADFTATINWGDGSPISTGTIVGPTGGPYSVEGGHTYAGFGTYTITTVVTDAGGSVVTLTNTATVTDLAPTGTYVNFTAQEGLNTGTIVLGTVTDPDTLATVADLQSTLVTWGDGTPATPVTIAVVPTGGTAGDTTFELLGSHTYHEEGTFTFTLTATTPGGVATVFTPAAGGTATVNDAPLTSSGSISITGTEGITTGTKVIATFTDANPFATTADFSGTVNWGDGGAPLPLVPGDFTESGTANGVQFTVSAAHTYSDEGSYQITVVIDDDGGSTTTAHASAVIADAALTATTPQPSIVASTGQSLPATTVVGTFIDANPLAPISDFTATIDWGDGTPIAQGTIVQPGGVGTVFDVEGGHTYATHGTYTIKTVVTDVGGSVVTLTNTATVTDAAPTGVYQSFTAQEGLNTGTIVLATVTDPNTLATPADLDSTLVTWGDGTPPTPVTIATVATGGNSSGTIFQLLGSHTYHEEGTFTFTLTSTTPGGVATTFTPTAGGTATVEDAPLSSSGSISITGIEGISTGTKVITTFSDANPFATTADFSGTIDWGDGGAPLPLVPGDITMTGSANGVLFTVSAAHTYAEEGSYQISVAISDDGGATTVGHASAVIADAPLTAGAHVALTPNTGVLLTNAIVGTFTDANPMGSVSDFTADIDWGDGTPATIAVIAQPGGVGTVFDVEGTHTYAKPGTYDITSVVTDVGGSVVTLAATSSPPSGGTATVTDAPLTGTARSFTAQEGLNTGTILLATVDNPNTLAGVSQLTATVNWGDSATDFVVPVSLVGGTPTDSIFQINGSHTYAEEGTFTVSVTVTTTGGATTTTSPLTATATVVDAPLVAVGSESISGVEGITTGPKLVATWTDSNPGATVADYTLGGGSVVVNWGDGTAPVTLPASAITATGSPNGVVFDATAAHTYAEEGNYQITTTIDDDGGSTAVAHGFAVIADAPLSAPPPVEATVDINPTTNKVDGGVITEDLPFTTVVATFTDANPQAPISDYNYVTIDWGDGSPQSQGLIIQPGGVGTTFEVIGTHTYTNFHGNGGSLDFTTTVNVHDQGGSTLAINNSVTVAEVTFAINGQLNPASDSGASNTDAITNVTQPNFFGTTTETLPNGQVVPAPNAQVSLFATPASGGSQMLIGQAFSSGAGTWSITSTVPLAQGKYVIQVTAVNQEGDDVAAATLLPNATQGELTIDTAGPKVTALSFDRVDGQIDVTFQDNLSGLNQAEVINAANYQLTKLNTPRGRYLVNVISATPSGPTGAETVVLTINNGRQLRGGIYTFTVFSGSGATGMRDVAGNALDGEFYGFFPSGNNIPGGNFVAGLNAVHHTIFAPKTLIGHATPVSPPGTPGTGTTIPTANPSLPSGNPNFHGNAGLLQGAKVHHKVQVHQAKKAAKKTANNPPVSPMPSVPPSVHDVALGQLGGGLESN